MKGKNILYVNWGTKDKEYTFEAAKRKGLVIYLATSRDYPQWVENYVPKTRIILTNTYDGKQLIEDVKRFIKEKKINFDGVITFFEMNMVQTAELAAVLKTNFIEPGSAKNSSANKYLMRTVCQKSGIKMPRFEMFENIEEGIEKLKLFDGEVVIKPIMSGHSYGVVKVLGKRDLVRKYGQAIKQVRGGFDEWMKYYGVFYEDKFLMEEYVFGKMISVDGLIQNGEEKFLAVTEFGLSKEPLFLQQQTYIPAMVSRQIQEKCKFECRRIYKALGFDNCGFHCEMRINKENEPILIEIAARLPGGQILEGYQKVFGVDLADMYLDICLGNKISCQTLTNKGFLLQETVPFKNEGLVKEVRFKKKWKDKTINIFSICQMGQLIKNEERIFPSIIYFQVMAKSLEKLKKKRKEIVNNIEIKIAKNWEYYYLVIMNMIHNLTPASLRKVFLGRGILRGLLVFLHKTNGIIGRSK